MYGVVMSASITGQAYPITPARAFPIVLFARVTNNLIFEKWFCCCKVEDVGQFRTEGFRNCRRGQVIEYITVCSDDIAIITDDQSTQESASNNPLMLGDKYVKIGITHAEFMFL